MAATGVAAIAVGVAALQGPGGTSDGLPIATQPTSAPAGQGAGESDRAGRLEKLSQDASRQAQLLAQAAGDPVDIDHDTALLTASQVGSHFAGWFSFQPLFEQIIRAQPDLLD